MLTVDTILQECITLGLIDLFDYRTAAQLCKLHYLGDVNVVDGKLTVADTKELDYHQIKEVIEALQWSMNTTRGRAIIKKHLAQKYKLPF